MIDISAQGTTITFVNDTLGSVTFNDVSDMGSPIEFGTLSPLGYEFDLNNQMSVWHRQIAPEVSLSFIPDSPSDRKLRAFLLSSVVSGSAFTSVSNILVKELIIDFPNRGKETGNVFILREGYLVGGMAGVGVSAEGRMTSAPYKFVFKQLSDGTSSPFGFSGNDGEYNTTQLCVDDQPIEGLYYARVSASASARMISHPIETGAVVFDQKYVEPEHVSVKVKIPLAIAQDVVAKFFKILTDRTLKTSGENKTSYSVYSKTEQYDNLSLLRISHDEAPDQFDLVEYTLEFQELLFAETEGFTETRSPSDQDEPPTRSAGTQSSRPSA